MNVLLDINVVLDVFLNRLPWVSEAAEVLRANSHFLIKAHLSAASLPTIFYIARRHVSRERAHLAIEECLSSFVVVPVQLSTLELAQRMVGPDFEDNLQIACATEGGLEGIVPRDVAGFEHCPLPVLAPADVVRKLSVPPATGP